MSTPLLLVLCLVSTTAAATPRLLDSPEPAATRVQLVEELEGLESARPRIWTGAGLMATGGVGVSVGLLCTLGGWAMYDSFLPNGSDSYSQFALRNLGVLIMVAAGIVAAAAVVVLIIGAVMTHRALAAREQHDAKIRDATQRVNDFDERQRPVSMPTLPPLGPTVLIARF